METALACTACGHYYPGDCLYNIRNECSCLDALPPKVCDGTACCEVEEGGGR